MTNDDISKYIQYLLDNKLNRIPEREWYYRDRNGVSYLYSYQDTIHDREYISWKLNNIELPFTFNKVILSVCDIKINDIINHMKYIERDDKINKLLNE